MGSLGLQGVLSGIGEGGEQAGQGLNAALNEALKVRAQQHQENVDTAHINLAQAAQQQAYTLAQQQHELMRQSMLQNGWTHTGTVKGVDGNYYQQFDNPRMPVGSQTTRIPYNGTPPDSLEAMLNNYKQLKEQGFEDTRAQQLAFKAVNLYRTDPAGLLQEYSKYAKELNEEKGVTKVPVFGFGNIDISTEAGQAKYAQAMNDSGRGYATLLRSLMGYGPKQNDMTGWTANEQREYKAVEAQQKLEEETLMKFYTLQMGLPTAMDPNVQNQIRQSMLEASSKSSKALQDKQDEINGRHNKTGPGAAPRKGAYRIGNTWYDEKTHQPIPTTTQ